MKEPPFHAQDYPPPGRQLIAPFGINAFINAKVKSSEWAPKPETACRRAAEAADIDYSQLVYPRIQKEVSLASLIPVRVMCRQAGVRRAGIYRWRHAPPAVDADLELRDQIQRIALDSPCYGWRRVTAELRRQGYTVNHRRVRRIMREDNLLCLRRKKCVVTTDSNHDRPVYPNLARSMVVTHTNQLCVANITYIRLESGFVYLAVSGTSSSVFITRGVCIQRWATARRRSLNECWLSGQMGCTDGLF